MKWAALALIVLLQDAKEGQRLFEAKRYEEAAKKLEAALLWDPKDAESAARLVACHIALKKFGEAVDALMLFEGDAFKNAEMAKQIDALLREVQSLRPEDRAAVIERFQKAFPGSPQQNRSDLILMRAFADLQNRERSEEIGKRLEALASPDPTLWYSVGYSYARAGSSRSIECLLKSLRLHKEALAKADEARRRTVEYRRQEASVSQVRSTLAWAYWKNKQFDNVLSQEEAEPGAFFEDVTEAAFGKRPGGTRVAAADWDGDGYDDLLIQGQLWINNRKGGFVSKAELGPATGCLFGDFDNDGKLDLLVAGPKEVRIYRNDLSKVENPGFAELPALPEGIALVDFDGDGLLDIYIACYEGAELGKGNRDFLYRNLGGMKFEDVTEKVGMGVEYTKKCGRGVACADFNNSGRPAIYVCNYRLQPNFFWVGEQGKFKDQARELGVQGEEAQGAYGHSIGAAWGDVDGDGWLDLIVGNLAHPRFIEFSNKTMVYRNEGGKFKNVFAESGIEYEETHSDVSMCDYDNDGDLDVYLTSIYEDRPSFLYQNDGTGKFRRVTWRAGAIQFNGWGHAWLDVDNDGQMDLIVCRAEANGVRLLRNKGSAGHWLGVRLKSKASVIGARVTIGKQIREVAGGRGTTSQDSLTQHFGFGNNDAAVDVQVRWPDGRTSERKGVKVDQIIEISPF